MTVIKSFCEYVKLQKKWKIRKIIFVFVGIVAFATAMRIISNIHVHLSSKPDIAAKLSPFYGMNHRDTYGQPRSNFENRTLNNSSVKWETFFPKTIRAVINMKTKTSVQNSKIFTSFFNVSLDKNNYYFGDEFAATIMSRDSNGNRKTFGGDYYRARLIRDNSSYPDGIPCRVTDNEDGSYTVKAPLVLNGRLTLEVVLVIPIEGIHEIIKKTKDVPSWGHLYVAELESGEKVICNTNLSTYLEAKSKGLCDYSNPRNGEPWYCVKPPSNNCSNIRYINYTGPGKGTNVDFTKICFDYGCRKKLLTESITVNLQKEVFSTTDRFKSSMCRNEFNNLVSNKPISGFFINGIWKTLICKSQHSSLLETKSCFKNKIVYLFGDSTIRQFFYLFVEVLGLTVNGPDNSVIWQQPKVAFKKFWHNYNTTIYFRAHGPPLINPGPPNTRPYISDLITDLPLGGDSVYVIFNIGAHLFHYDPNMYIHRLNGIRHAILRHHEQFPNTKFIVRGLNVVEFLYEWNIFRFEEILFETFRSLRNVVYLNLWDLTTVWPLDDYHPRDPVLHQQALFMTQYLCP